MDCRVYSRAIRRNRYRNAENGDMSWYRKLASPLPISKTPYPRHQPGVQWDGNRDPYSVGVVDRILPQDKADQISQQHPNLDYLGSGTYGIAYNSGDDKTVVKLTTDISEWRAAKMQMQKKAPCVVQVYDVKHVATKEHEGEVWQITTERLQTLSVHERKLIFRFRNISCLRHRGDLPTADMLLRDTIIDGATEQDRPIAEKYLAMCRCLEQHGFRIDDTHGDNIGMRPGDGSYVLLDLGLSVA